MRRARVTYQGALHHVMSRGIKGEDILLTDDLKGVFLDFMTEKSKKVHIKILAYCLMNNHYHLVLQNSSGRMSDFMRQLNGQYGMFYRKKQGGEGYVFQNRYKSTIIQKEFYLAMAIAYVLMNPERAGIVKNFEEYKWSSAKEYFSDAESEIVDSSFVNELFSNKEELYRLARRTYLPGLPAKKTRFGDIIGEEHFIEEATEKSDRRKKMDGTQRKRIDDRYFEPVKKVIQEFERKHKIKIENIDIDSFTGKRLRGELLVNFKELSGLIYSEIIEFPIFSDLQLSSLGKLYRDAKKRLRTSGGE